MSMRSTIRERLTTNCYWTSKGRCRKRSCTGLRLRLNGAQRRKAQRGEMRFAAPTGYVWDRKFEMDPDLAVQQAIGIIFERFAAEPTANAVVRWGAPGRISSADAT
jgi:hypothetical protein